MYLLFRLFVELESTRVKMALPTLPGEMEELLLVMRTEKKTPKKQLVLQRGAESPCDQFYKLAGILVVYFYFGLPE